MSEKKNILHNNFSSGFLSSKFKTRNTFQLYSPTSINKQTIIHRLTPQRNNTLRITKNDSLNKLYLTNIKSNNHKNETKSKIYLRLPQKDEIEKIISEEEKKRYFNQEFHLKQNINREELQKRIFNKIPFNEISNKILKKRKGNTLSKDNKRPNTTIASNIIKFKKSRNFININKKLFQNFKSQGEDDIEKSKQNYDMVSEFLKKMDEDKLTKFNEMEKNYLKKNSNSFDKNKSHISHRSHKSSISEIEEDKKHKKKKIEDLKLKESEFIKFKKRQMIKENQYFKQKSKVFDNILRYDFNNYYSIRNEEGKYQTVNYRLLSRTILMRNLMKQMKVTVFKDESLNVLRGFQSLKITNLANDEFNNDNQDIYRNQNDDNIFFFGNKIRHKPIPHFLKVKFNKKTSRKFGEINGSYFGLPV